MREIVLGTAGHVDHGKTSFVRALTGIDCDRLKEEKARGITIELGFAFLDLPCGHRLGIVDVPGHERFVKNMVAGASGMDMVAFIIAADEGIMPQSREHFDICRLMGVERGLVVITKVDMVDGDWLALVEDEVREFVAGSFLEGAPMVRVSSTSGQGIEEVRKVLDRLVADTVFVETHGPFRLPVDRVFTMKGFGAVVTGTSISGRIKTGDDVVVYPWKKSGKIRGIQVHGAERTEVEAGHRTAINVQGVSTEEIHRGDVLASPESLQPSYILDADFLFLSSAAKPLKNRSRVRVHSGTAEIIGRIVLLEADEIAPGTEANVQLILEQPVGVWPGDRYVVRSYSPVATIGGGRVLNGAPRKRKRATDRDRARNQEVFALYRDGTPEDHALYHLEESGYPGLTFERLATRLGIFGNRLKKLLSPPLSSKKILVVDSERQRMVAATVLEKLMAACTKIIADYHRDNPLKPGLVKEELRSRLYRNLEPRLFQLALTELGRRGTVVQEGALVRSSEHRVALQEEEETLRKEIAAAYRDGALAPPTVNEVLARFDDRPAPKVKEMIGVLLQEQTLTKISETLLFDAGVLAALQDKVRAHLEKHGEIDAQGFKEMTGATRKFSIPLLEHFDKVKLTIRVGDKRILREKRP